MAIADTKIDIPILVYDGECGVCSAFAGLMLLLVPRLRILPFQDRTARSTLAGLHQEELERSAHLVLPDGRILSGADAFSALLDLLPLVGRLHRRLSALPVLRGLEGALYSVGVELRERTRCADLRRSSS
jgi:predicted DCC family thiol-disulfide oxidoreductase YuxK